MLKMTSQTPMEGIELGALVLAIATSHLGLGAHDLFETDLILLTEDIESCFQKGAKEWLSCVQ